MEKAKPNKKLIIILAIALVMLVVAFGLIYALTRPQTDANEKTVVLKVVHGDCTEKLFSIQTDAEFLRGAIEEHIWGQESEYGLFVEKVDGETADASLQQWWCLTKGGDTVMTGVNDTPIYDGDQFEFTLTTGW